MCHTPASREGLSGRNLQTKGSHCCTANRRTPKHHYEFFLRFDPLIAGNRERRRKRARQDSGRPTDRQRETEKARKTDRSRLTDRQRETEKARETDSGRQTDRQRETEKARETDSGRPTDRHKETEKVRETDSGRPTDWQRQPGAERQRWTE